MLLQIRLSLLLMQCTLLHLLARLSIQGLESSLHVRDALSGMAGWALRLERHKACHISILASRIRREDPNGRPVDDLLGLAIVAGLIGIAGITLWEQIAPGAAQLIAAR